MSEKVGGNNSENDESNASYCEVLPFETLREACRYALGEESVVIAEELVDVEVVEDVVEEDSMWGSPEFHVPVENGEYSDDDREARTKILAGGEKIFTDAGISFYYVNPGDTLGGIKSALSGYPEFSYLEENKHSSSISGFNVPLDKLQVNSWLPIPLPHKERVFEKSDFVVNCHAALKDLESHPEYAAGIKTILEKISTTELLASMLAVAQVEAGGEELGQFSYHRYESHLKTFSYSIFHVLDSNEGLRARRKLNLSIGQCYHPKNAAKLFLAFICEKSQGDPGKYFPFSDESESFATFYNGNWAAQNKSYPADLKEYYRVARNDLARVDFPILDFSKAVIPPHVLDARRGVDTTSVDIVWSGDSLKFYSPRKDDWSFYQLLVESNYGNSRNAGLGGTSFLKHDATIKSFSQCVMSEMGDTSPNRSDRMAIGKDEGGVFVVYIRGDEVKKFYYS
jgi:hypothetical protein